MLQSLAANAGECPHTAAQLHLLSQRWGEYLDGGALPEQFMYEIQYSDSVPRNSAPPCAIKPAHLTLHTSEQGFQSVGDEEAELLCSAHEPEVWSRMAAGPVDLMVSTDGPEGSGRYWTVAIGVAGSGEVAPARGVCVRTSTIGWRSLQHFEGRALPWLEDVDGDGSAEAILWESFGLDDEPIPPAVGLVAWVYVLSDQKTLTIDWALSQQMALRVAGAYAAPLERDDKIIGRFRNLAARALQSFGEGRCSVQGQRTEPPADM
jgi:hypothetical protein